MADDNQDNASGDAEGLGGDDNGGLDNLPPLSDFDSGSGFQSDEGLPPLGSFDSDGDKGKDTTSGLPPIGDISVETPEPTGGNIKPAPPGFDSQQSGFDTPAFETPSFATPTKDKSGSGFQDLAADSDFSPETPEIGPGPDSDMDTPMFDSAFGGGEAVSGLDTPKIDTPAPTQAMETPMFGAEVPEAPSEGGPPAFDEGAFGAALGGAPQDAGTPIPDFSPDTGASAGPVPPDLAELPTPEVKPKKKVKGGSSSILVKAALIVIGLAVGLLVGPFFAKGIPLPYPVKATLNEKDAEIDRLDALVKKLQGMKTGEGPAVSQKQLDEMLDQKKNIEADINELKGTLATTQTAVSESTANLGAVDAELQTLNEEYVKTQESFEELQNQTAIVQAQHMGLRAEVERLTGLVGELEDSNVRRLASKEALENSVDRLTIQVREGIPLTPEKYSRARRLAAVEDLRAKVDAAKWVTPALLDAYTNLYLDELAIAAATDYFFAKLPVTDNLGNKLSKWSECLMKGNTTVYYRTLDGKNIGSYQDVGPAGQPQYAFIENLPEEMKIQIEQEILTARVPDFEQKLVLLEGRQRISDNSATPLQRVYDSL